MEARACWANSECVPARLWAPVIFLSGMHDQIFFFRLDADLMNPFAGISPVRRIAQAVLIAQIFLNLGVDFLDRLFAGDFKELSAGFARDLFQNFLSVRA